MGGLLLAASEEQVGRRIKDVQVMYGEISESEMLSQHFSFFGANDLRHLHLVLDPEIQWEKIDFLPHKALAKHFIDRDGKQWREISEYTEGNSIPDGAWLVDEGRDHEHCIFCSNRIDKEVPGYKSHHEMYGDEWACQWCYRHSVELHDPRPLLFPYKSRDFSSL